jgi:hypothetical protein
LRRPNLDATRKLERKTPRRQNYVWGYISLNTNNKIQPEVVPEAAVRQKGKAKPSGMLQSARKRIMTPQVETCMEKRNPNPSYWTSPRKPQ